MLIKNLESITEMRILPNGMNARIYCKQIASKKGDFYVIAAKLFRKKKSQSIDKSIQQFIKPIEDFNYDI